MVYLALDVYLTANRVLCMCGGLTNSLVHIIYRNNILGAARTSTGTSWDTGRAHLQSCHGIQDSVDYCNTWIRNG